MGGIVQSKKRLFIIGAGGFGREIESWLELIPISDRNWELIGYLDKNKNALNNYPAKYSIVGDEDNYDLNKDDLVIFGLSEPKIKENLYNKLKNQVSFFTYIAPSVIIGKFNNIGEGSVICPNCILTTNIEIGKLVTINCGTQIGHDSQIGDFCTINSQIEIAGNCKLEEKVFMGSNSMIIPGRKIGRKAVIGAGSVVIRNVKENTTVFGNPAKRI